MRHYSYSYQDAKGLRHEGELKAASKDDAYAELRKQGIRPIKVTERIAPIVRRGFKGLRKRDMVCLVIAALCLVAVAWCVAVRSKSQSALGSLPRYPAPAPQSVESLTSDPAMQEELKKVIKEREAVERECRERFIRRVNEGSLTKKEANELFRAMGMEELK